MSRKYTPMKQHYAEIESYIKRNTPAGTSKKIWVSQGTDKRISQKIKKENPEGEPTSFKTAQEAYKMCV